MKELEDEMEELRVQMHELRESLEKETLSKVDLQNQNQSLKEELAFKKKVYEEVCTGCMCCQCVGMRSVYVHNALEHIRNSFTFSCLLCLLSVCACAVFIQ